jgi:hypothetical protein
VSAGIHGLVYLKQWVEFILFAEDARKQRCGMKTFFKKRDSERRYLKEVIGPIIVERVQMPHSLREQDGSEYECMTYTMSLRVDDGRVLAERRYIIGEPEALAKFRRFGYDDNSH